MSRQVYVSPERMVVQKLEKYPAPFQDSHFDHSRYQEIEEEFKALDTDQSGWLSIQEIEQHLKRKGCDQKLIQEIFNDLNTNMDQKISKDEFAQGYLIKEQNLKADIKQQELKIKELRTNVEEVKKQFTHNNSSQLLLTLQSGCLTQYYKSYDDVEKAARQIEITIICDEATDGHARMSKPSLNCEFPVWGDKLQYLLNQAMSVNLTIEINEIHKLEKKQLAKLVFNKPLLQDFNKQEKIIFENIGEILMQIQFISDSNQYAEFQTELVENQIRQLFEETKQLKRKLNFMQQLYVVDNQQFRGPKSSERPQILQQSNNIVPSQQQFELKLQSQQEFKPQIQVNPEYQQNTPLTDVHKQEMVMTETIHLDYQVQVEFVDAFNIFKHSIREPDDIVINLDTLNNQERFKLLCFMLGVITLNTAFGHCDYLGLLLMLYCIPYQNKKWNSQQTKFFTISIVFSLILDFYWLLKYVNCFSNSYQCNNEFGMTLLIYFLCLLTFFAKMFVLYKIRSYQ